MSGEHGGQDALLERIHSFIVAGERNELSEDRWNEFEQLLREDDEACRLYAEYMDVSIFLPAMLDMAPADDSLDCGIAVPEAPALTLVATPNLLGSLAPSAVDRMFSGWGAAYLIAAVVLGFGLLIASLVTISHSVQIVKHNLPSKSSGTATTESVARITGMVDCVWEGSGFRVQGSGTANEKSEIRNQKSLLCLGDQIALKSGLLEITYDTGARVVLQGPVGYEVESAAGGYLSVGKLTAKLEKSEVRGQRSELSNHKSFAVRTPTAMVTDLGTEFGVEVDKQGSTTSHVFRGSVRVQVVAADGNAVTTEDGSRILHEDESVRVDGGAKHKIVALGNLKPPHFIREIPKQKLKILDLVDVVAGGDGSSGKRGRGIDPTTGKIVDRPPRLQMLPGDGRYHRVEGVPFVDGVFIPDTRHGAVQTDSAGHTSDIFGTAQNGTWHYVWAGGAIPVRDSRRTVAAVLGGVDYSASDHGVLYMHANKGITFDLDAIRRANPGDRLLRFRTVVGNAEQPARAGLHGNSPAKTLLSEDFQSATTGVFRGGKCLNHPESKDMAAWQLCEPQIMDRTEIAAERMPDGAGFNKYLEIPRWAIRVEGWNVNDTEDQLVQLSASVQVFSHDNAMAMLDGCGRQSTVEENRPSAKKPEDRVFTVYLRADGRVSFWNGEKDVETDLVCHPDVWQNVIVTADMATRTFSIKVDDQPPYVGGYWLSDATRVDHLLIGNNTRNGAVCFDNIRFGIPESTPLDGVRPSRAAADAWVLVDGERRAGRRTFNRASGPYAIVVPIADDSHFLTLVATDSGDDLFWDWVYFGDPRLELVPVSGPHETHMKAK